MFSMIHTFRIAAVTSILVASLSLAGSAHATTIDTVVSHSLGVGYGIVDGSDGSYSGPVGAGVYDPAAVTALDGVALALGGGLGDEEFGSIVVSFSFGAVFDGAGADLRLYDSNGLSEGISVEASGDGLTFVNIGSFLGNSSQVCSPDSPCATDFDLNGSGLTSASIFRLTVTGFIVSSFPQAYDLDTVEALNYRTSVIPLPASLPLFLSGLIGLGVVSRKRRKRGLQA